MSMPRRPQRPARTTGQARGGVRQSLDAFIDREIGRRGSFIVALVIIAAAVGNLWDPIQIWFDQQSRLSALDDQLSKARAQLAEAQSDIARWKDRAYIEAQARQRLMFVYPGDISYLVVNDVKPDAAPKDQVSATVSATSIDWVDAFLQSYAFAAAPEQATK